jgi:hypothetical protein
MYLELLTPSDLLTKAVPGGQRQEALMQAILYDIHQHAVKPLLEQ